MENLKVKKLSPNAKIPTKATASSAGFDLYACIEGPVMIPARGRVSVPTGIALEIEAGFAGFLYGRSGLGIRHGLVPSNAVGIIDSDFRGEIVVGLSNHSDTDYFIQPYERVAQLLFQAVLSPKIIEADELTDTERGKKGLGSTGRQ